MATFDFVIDASFIGQTIGPSDGFVVKIARTQAGPREIVDWDEGRQRFKAGRFVLRGSRDIRDLVCVDTQSDGGWGSSGTGLVVANGSIGFRGDLVIVCCPRGSTWSLTLSDVPYIPPPPTWPPTFPREAEERIAALRANIISEREPALIER